MEVGKMIKIEGRVLLFVHDSWIKTVKYNIDSKTLLINEQYESQDVPLEIFIEFAVAPSKGKYYNNEIKGKFLNDNFK